MNSSGGLGAPTVRTLAVPPIPSNPGASAVKSQAPLRRPIIAQRPRSSLVAVNSRGEAFGLRAVTVAPLIGLPSVLFTTP